MKINHDIQLSDGKLKHFLNINNLPKSIIEDIINRAEEFHDNSKITKYTGCLLYTSPSPRDLSTSRMPSSA